MKDSLTNEDYVSQLLTQMKKGFLVYCVLSICSKSDVYSSDIIRRLHKANLIVVEGTIYPLLSRLQKDGVLVHVWQESAKGPPRKNYQITKDGKEILQQLRKNSSQLQAAIEAIEKE